jgi:hypothetical protein
MHGKTNLLRQKGLLQKATERWLVSLTDGIMICRVFRVLIAAAAVVTLVYTYTCFSRTLKQQCDAATMEMLLANPPLYHALMEVETAMSFQVNACSLNGTDLCSFDSQHVHDGHSFDLIVAECAPSGGVLLMGWVQAHCAPKVNGIIANVTLGLRHVPICVASPTLEPACQSTLYHQYLIEATSAVIGTDCDRDILRGDGASSGGTASFDVINGDG